MHYPSHQNFSAARFLVLFHGEKEHEKLMKENLPLLSTPIILQMKMNLSRFALHRSTYLCDAMIKRKEQFYEESGLTESMTIPVRFSEVDSLGIVWHGHYILYFEQGREAFGKTYSIDYMTIQKAGYTTPIVKSICEHKLPLRYGDTARIVTSYVDTPAAKMIFRFKIYNAKDQLVCQGETVQVFLDKAQNLVLNIPDFVLDWKRKVGLL